VHPHPRAISIGVRTMEHYRRLGLDQRTIEAGVPRTHKLDVVYVTRVLGRELYRFEIPSIADLETDRAALAQRVPEIAASPYYKTWTAQAPLERMLRAHVMGLSQVHMRVGWRLDGFMERESAVAATLVECASGRTESIKTNFLVGCDGANSAVRAILKIPLEGRGTLGQAAGIYFRAPELAAKLMGGGGVMHWVLAPGCGGVIYTINGGDEWCFNRYFGVGENCAVTDPAGLVRAAVGTDIPIEILSVQNWLPRQLVAKRYGSPRCFLAGDACHLFVPTGGFGMNTGIGDAVDLAWKMEAVLKGWGGPGLLASYEAERRPIGLRNTIEAADNYDRSGEIFAVPAAFEEAGPAGDAARAVVVSKLPPKIKHFAPIGVHLGNAYENSPIILADGTPAPPFEAANYKPTTRPGHRAPHVWIREGKSTLDLFGRGFTMLRFDQAVDVSALATAARAAGVPLAVHDIDDPMAAQLYERKLVLVRPDGHVAWRGDEAPGKDHDTGNSLVTARALIDRVRGALWRD